MGLNLNSESPSLGVSGWTWRKLWNLSEPQISHVKQKRYISHLGQVLAFNVRVLHILFDHELYQDELLTFYIRIKTNFIYIHTHTHIHTEKTFYKVIFLLFVVNWCFWLFHLFSKNIFDSLSFIYFKLFILSAATI